MSDDSTPVVSNPIPAIPSNVILDIHNMRMTEDMTFETAGQTPHPFRRNTPESFLDKLRSVVATYLYRERIQKLKEENVDFSTYLYIPEIDPIMGTPRIAKSIRDGKDNRLNYKAFDDVLSDPKSGLTHAALIGKRKQSLVDAERLLSYHVVESLKRNGHEREAKHVEVIANWHEATDGRGISQLKHCKYNYLMMQYILDDWMPSWRPCYDF